MSLKRLMTRLLVIVPLAGLLVAACEDNTPIGPPGALASIVVSPDPTTMAPSVSQQFTATGYDANGRVVAMTPAWSIVANGGTITPGSGMFTSQSSAGGPFTNTIRATSGAISGYATVTVVAAPQTLASIVVTPNPSTLVPGGIQQFTATGYSNTGVVMAIAPSATWTVVPAVGGGTINSGSGSFTAGATAGTFTNAVKATSGTISGYATVIINASGTVGPPLGTAATYGILAGTAVTCVNLGSIAADVGVSPGSAVTGFPPCTITGARHVADAVAGTAQGDLTTAYNQLVGMPCGTTITANLGGTTLAPGVYCTATSIGVTGTVTLDGQGNPNALFVFQAGTGLTTAGSVVLIGGAQAKNVYWQVGSSATIGTASAWQGNILALTSITLVDNATLKGRALARNGAVSLGTNNAITLP